MKTMKTMKWLKRSQRMFAVFLFFCFLSVLGFFLHSRTFHDLFLGVGLVGLCGGMANPLPWIFAIIGIRHYLSERRDPEVRGLVGKQWLLLPGIVLGTAAAVCLTSVLVVGLTGGV